MIDPDLKKQLTDINLNLIEIKKKTGASVWKSFLTGTLSGLGSIFGVAIAIAIIGLILNAVGVIPAFSAQVHQWQQILDNLSKLR